MKIGRATWILHRHSELRDVGTVRPYNQKKMTIPRQKSSQALLTTITTSESLDQLLIWEKNLKIAVRRNLEIYIVYICIKKK